MARETGRGMEKDKARDRLRQKAERVTLWEKGEISRRISRKRRRDV